jgi:hypothetical protein
MGMGVTLSAAAGPSSNLVLAVLCAALCGTLVRFHVIGMDYAAGQVHEPPDQVHRFGLPILADVVGVRLKLRDAGDLFASISRAT